MFELRDILFINNLKPLRPINNYDEIIYDFFYISISIRLLSNIFLFSFIFYSSKFEKELKRKMMNSVVVTSENHNTNYKNIINLNTALLISSVNYTDANSCEEKCLEESTIRCNMDELNKKIKAGEIFTNNSSLNTDKFYINSNNNLNI